MKTTQRRFDTLVVSYWQAYNDNNLEAVVAYQQALIEMGGQKDCNDNWQLVEQEVNLLEDCV